MIVFLRNRLKYALNYTEVTKIMKQRLIKIDGKVRTDTCFPAGFMGKTFIKELCLHFPSMIGPRATITNMSCLCPKGTIQLGWWVPFYFGKKSKGRRQSIFVFFSGKNS